jgi:hypothetical protein
MVSIQAGVMIVTILFGSAMLAVLAGQLLPEHHLSTETKTARASPRDGTVDGSFPRLNNKCCR